VVRRFASAFARDAALAAFVLLLAEGEVLSGSIPGPHVAEVVLAFAMAIPLLWRRRFPLATAFVVLGSLVVQWAIGIDLFNYLATVVAGIVALYSVAAHAPLRRSLPGLAYGYGAVAVSALRGPAGLAWGAILVGGAWGAGCALRDRRGHVAQLAELNRELELARDENARAAVTEERARIARELHDVVAHAVSVMVVQAGAAEQVLDADSSPALEPLLAVQRTGRQALVELRRLLGVLRADDRAAGRGPQPGLAEIEALARTVREAGVDVGVHLDGDHTRIPTGLDLAAYRIVQEALTNTLKHAEASRVDVRVRIAGEMLELAVEDDGRGPADPNGRGGHGLVGMRERALLYGGELRAGARSGRGFAVLARLPLGVER
jgi:signal transduction histidine kinase